MIAEVTMLIYRDREGRVCARVRDERGCSALLDHLATDKSGNAVEGVCATVLAAAFDRVRRAP